MRGWAQKRSFDFFAELWFRVILKFKKTFNTTTQKNDRNTQAYLVISASAWNAITRRGRDSCVFYFCSTRLWWIKITSQIKPSHFSMIQVMMIEMIVFTEKGTLIFSGVWFCHLHNCTWLKVELVFYMPCSIPKSCFRTSQQLLYYNIDEKEKD